MLFRMKKIMALALCLMLFFGSVSAKSGDIAGEYYATDIKTFLNGAEIHAINIGGQTLISAEDMSEFGFEVNWYALERRLEILSSEFSEKEMPSPVLRDGKAPGSEIGYYYETDIVTTLDNTPITAYNIGGRTYIHAESMKDFGYLTRWDEKRRFLTVTAPDTGEDTYTIHMTYDEPKTEEASGEFCVVYKAGKKLAAGDSDYFISSITKNSEGDYVFSMAFYQNGGLFYSSALTDKLKKLASDGMGLDFEKSEEELYDEISRSIHFSVNGYASKKMKIALGGGNGHRDYSIIAKDLPVFNIGEIREIKISLGECDSELSEIIVPEYIQNGL